MPRDHYLFVGRERFDSYTAGVGRYESSAARVAFVVEPDAQVFQARADLRSHRGRVSADPPGKDQTVDATESRCQGPNVRARPSAEIIDRIGNLRTIFLCKQLPHVRAYAR